MKITCVGTDPAGLYLGILLKRKNPSHLVRFIEWSGSAGNPPVSIICNPVKPRLKLADSDILAELNRIVTFTDRVTVTTADRSFESGGLRHGIVDERTLVDVLTRHAAAAGCQFEDGAAFAGDDDADVIVASDGAASRLRESTPGLAPSVTDGTTRFAVFESAGRRDSLSHEFRATSAGIFHAFAMPRDHAGSCIIVEAPAETIRDSGLEHASAEAVLGFCRDLFALPIERLMPNGTDTVWRSFATVRNKPWHAGKIVLLGRAAYTSHPALGLDIRSGLEDAEALAECLTSEANVPDALAAFEAARRPKAESLQRASEASQSWFENVVRYTVLPFDQFVFSLLTNSMRITYARIEKAAPELTGTIDGIIAGQQPDGSNKPPPPMFASYQLRDLKFANRVAVSPMCMYSCKDGTVNDFHLVHLGSRAIGGAGLVITEMTDVLPEGRISLHCAGMYSPEHVPAWKRVVDFVHANSDSKIAVQLAHAGRKGSLTRSWEGHQSLGEAKWEILAPSPLAFAAGRQVPRAMNRDDMDKVRDAFIRATQMSDEAGFDMIELHFAHGYLISSFISPLTNQRTDEYGGSLENRMRFPLEIFSAVRAAWPAHKPISTRISSVDWLEGGNTIEDGLEVGRMLHRAGNDILAVSAGGVSSAQHHLDGRVFQTLYSDQIRNEANIPTMAVGGIVSHGDINTIVAAGRADMCALGRGYLEDAYFARHAAREQNYKGMRWPSQYRRAGEVQLRGA